MKVSELFESVRVDHAAVVSAIYGLAQKLIKADAGTKSAIARLIKSSDEFWSSDIDDVTRELERMGTKGVDGFYDAVDRAVESVLDNMVEYFSNNMNHEPGYKAPKISKPDHVEIPTKTIDAAFSKFPQLASRKAADASKSKADASKAADEFKASFTPEAMSALVSILKAEIKTLTSPAGLKKIAKMAKEYDLPAGFAPTSIAELKAGIVSTKSKTETDDQALVDFFLAGADAYRKTSKIVRFSSLLKDKAACKKLVQASGL